MKQQRTAQKNKPLYRVRRGKFVYVMYDKKTKRFCVVKTNENVNKCFVRNRNKNKAQKREKIAYSGDWLTREQFLNSEYYRGEATRIYGNAAL